MTAPIALAAGTYFVTGIDTDVGKTIATGWLAKQLLQQGQSVITQKFVQTGGHENSDIAVHRALMGVPPLPEDGTGLTEPAVFAYPASPHLAAALEGRAVPVEEIVAATNTLAERYDVVLVEGAGGLLVPLDDNVLLADVVAAQAYPVILVTSGRLGSINHTLLSLEALQQRGMEVAMVLFNRYHDSADSTIAEDTCGYLQRYVASHFPRALWQEMAEVPQA
ncbi:MAG TPA: dethiobiotin synthase [Alcanivoracaceae bacterium]|nr:dethiobiotin synthase [Alcanivoracaceae bacterium]